jgi:predicted molibdopterin-dependent oxidoreductase YjgC
VKRKGVGLTIISDKKGKLAKLPGAATLVHRPGAEVALVNAMARVILDENLQDAAAASQPGYDALKAFLAGSAPADAAAVTGLDAGQIAEMARTYAREERALIILPLGQGYPGHGKELAQALINLAALTGRFGKEGSGIIFLGEKNNTQGAVDLEIAGQSAAGILDGCSNGSVKTLYVIGENPVVSYPNRKGVEKALEQVEFLVVQDLFLTETAAKADVVLPACSFAEKEGTFTSAGRILQKVNRAIKPLAGSRSDLDIISGLAAAMGAPAPFGTPAEAFAAIAATVPAYKGLTYGTLSQEGTVLPVAVSAKLVPVAADAPAAVAGAFALLTGSALHHNGTLSLYGEGPTAVSPAGYVEFCREDAAALGLKDDDLVKVASAVGEVQLKVKVGLRMAKGTVFAPYHFAEGSINTVATGSPVTWVTISK